MIILINYHESQFKIFIKIHIRIFNKYREFIYFQFFFKNHY